MSFDVLSGGDAATFLEWLIPYTEAMGVEVLVTDGHDSYGVVASALGLEHQLCLTHSRKALARQIRVLRTKARTQWGAGSRLTELLDDLELVQQLAAALPEDGSARLWPEHTRYLDAAPPRKGETASI